MACTDYFFCTICNAGLLVDCNLYTPLQDFSFSWSDRQRHIQIDFNRLCVSRMFVKRYDTKSGERTNIIGIFHRTKKKPRSTNNFKNSKPFAILPRASRNSLSLYSTTLLPLIDDSLEACKVFVRVFFIRVNGRVKKKLRSRFANTQYVYIYMFPHMREFDSAYGVLCSCDPRLCWP